MLRRKGKLQNVTPNNRKHEADVSIPGAARIAGKGASKASDAGKLVGGGKGKGSGSSEFIPAILKADQWYGTYVQPRNAIDALFKNQGERAFIGGGFGFGP